MRRILLVLFALAFAVPAAEAAQPDRHRGQTASRSTHHAAQPSRQAAQRQHASRPQTRRPASRQQASRSHATRQQASRRQAPRHSALRPGDVRTSRSDVVVRGASAARVQREASARNCTRRNGRRVCSGPRSSIAGWQNGLPAVNYAQRECPAGTMATLARGHDDVVRCLPL